MRLFSVPSELFWVGSNPYVRMVELAEKDLKQPFWDQTLARQLRTVKLLPLDTVEIDSSVETGITGFIYHYNRCGSTLVANCFRSIPGCNVLSEPFVFQQLLDTNHGDRGQRRARLRKLMSLHLSLLEGGRGGLIIKWPSLIGLYVREIESAFPEAPGIFLYRDPAAVLVSVRKSPLGGMELLSPHHLGISRTTQGDLESISHVMANICRHLAAAANLRSINYTKLPDAIWALIAPYFRLDLDPSGLTRMRETATYYSKDRSQKLKFLSDSEEKAAAIDHEIELLAKDIIEPALSELLSSIKPLTFVAPFSGDADSPPAPIRSST